MAELFRFPPAQIGTGLSHIPEPVGYTEDDVRRLAMVYARITEGNELAQTHLLLGCG